MNFLSSFNCFRSCSGWRLYICMVIDFSKYHIIISIAACMMKVDPMHIMNLIGLPL